MRDLRAGRVFRKDRTSGNPVGRPRKHRSSLAEIMGRSDEKISADDRRQDMELAKRNRWVLEALQKEWELWNPGVPSPLVRL